MGKVIGFIGSLLLLVGTMGMVPTSYTYAEELSHFNKKLVDVQVLSFNIHHAVGIDGVLDMERIANTIELGNAEIIGLQEVDKHWSGRSHFENQTKWLAERLDMHYTYAANLDRDPLNAREHRRQYGTAILSKYPIISAQNHLLSKVGNTEQRGLLEAKINVKGNLLEVYNTHLSLTTEERQLQMDEIVAISHDVKGPKVIMGDLNTTPESNEMQLLLSNFHDSFAHLIHAFTYYADDGTPKRIDYILTSKGIKTSNVKVISSLASDHLPLTATLTFFSPEF
ncbi:endonuclease/exonuclease/phosphatase family protein [Peribacillus sp. NPDC097675]|uniref:endonuclease/exonuclease/phosphatase family protein n=1 Tax=Peribacillus sp. NPDC097675 TaxID=3390618 RepID=UPI003D056744